MPPPRVPAKVTDKVYMDFEVSSTSRSDDDNTNTDNNMNTAAKGETEILRLTFHLYGEQCPTAVQNFLHLVKGDLGTQGSISGKPLDYKNSQVHRIVPHFMIQAGDFTHGTGVGGEAAMKQRQLSSSSSSLSSDAANAQSAIYFDDDPACLSKSVYTDKYFVSMANKGPNTNGSQFFITTVKTRWLDHKHMLFGRLAIDDDFDDSVDGDGDDVDANKEVDNNLFNLNRLESFGTSSGKPSKTIRIVDCGVLPLHRK
jgi:cyclophilin family peptidyl-prolyl cis-trans isomerase